MNNLIAFIIGASLWRMGGVKGKWWRRYILPFCITIYTLIVKQNFIYLLMFPLLAGAFSLPYGEKHPYWQKFLAGLAWILPAVIFNQTWIALIVPFIWIGLYKLSNTKPYSNIFLWWVVEVLVGGMIGVSYVHV